LFVSERFKKRDTDMEHAGKKKTENISIVGCNLKPDKKYLSINQIGFTMRQIQRISELTEEKSGLILVCGPCHAGKSTTAAAVLLMIQKDSACRRKIVNLEKFPGYAPDGITHINIDHSKKRNCETLLNSVFCQNPDVIMTGEIRDKKSAMLAVLSALAGCLVLSSLCADDTADAFTRMVDFGVDPLELASVLKGVIIQKLIREKNRITFLADVASARKKIKTAATRQYTPEELDGSFMHCTNVISEIRKSIERLRPPVYTCSHSNSMSAEEHL
jgi:type II secretory ATPase GspE/PulE/Tfp pilus assembly ATPase PilB-like protein